MNRTDCPAPRTLHDLVDGAPVDEASRLHATTCPSCVAAIESLIAVDAFVAPSSADVPTADEMRRVVEGATARAATLRRRSFVGVALAVVLAAAALWHVDPFAASVTPREAPTAPTPDAGPSEVDAGHGESDAVERRDVPRIPVARAPSSRPRREAPPPTFQERLEEVFTSSKRTDELVRKVERLLVDETPAAPDWDAAVHRLLDEAGVRAEPAIHRMIRRRLPAFEDVVDLYGRMRGVDATSALVSGYLTASSTRSGAVALATLKSRPGALDAARRAARAASRDDVLRASALVARLGGEDAIDRLGDAVRSGGFQVDALEALCALATPEALVVVARLLPTAEEWDFDAATPEAGEVERVMKAATDAGFRAATAAASVSRISDRRRLLVLAGLSGDAATRAPLTAALERRDERAAAFIGLALLGIEESAPAIAEALARTNDRSTRRRGVEALAATPGREAIEALAELRKFPEDRLRAFEALKKRPEATSSLFGFLAHSDVRADAAAELRRRFGKGAPAADDWAVWARWRREENIP